MSQIILDESYKRGIDMHVYMCVYVYVCIVLHCIVLYLYISIAPIAVHINQKRFQCKRHREKRVVLRERKEVLGSPVNKAYHVEEGSSLVPKRRAFDCKGSCLSHRNPRSRGNGCVWCVVYVCEWVSIGVCGRDY